jgi:hypothetical protein
MLQLLRQHLLIGTWNSLPQRQRKQADATYGEIFTLLSDITPNSFAGPVDAVGEFDWIFTQGNAYYPSNQAALVQPALFPNASKGSQSYVVPGAGHAINLHYAAGLMFDQVQGFVKSNGF